MRLTIKNLVDNSVHSYSMQIRHSRHTPFNPKSKNKSAIVTILSAVKDGYKLPRIFVARCNPTDDFNKKQGKFRALIEMIKETFGEGYFIQDHSFPNGSKEMVVTINFKESQIGSDNYNECYIAEACRRHKYKEVMPS